MVFGGDCATAVAFDSMGYAYVTGSALSTDFPIANAVQTSLNSAYGNAFVSELIPDGSGQVYSTHLGGSGKPHNEILDGDFGNAIALDSAGNASATGQIESPDFLVAAPYQGSLVGSRNAFVAELTFPTVMPTPTPTISPTPTPTPYARRAGCALWHHLRVRQCRDRLHVYGCDAYHHQQSVDTDHSRQRS